MSPFLPLGVDILEWKKAAAFYDRHGDRLRALLHSDELAFVRASAKPFEAFALIFSAKEAVFKALGAPFLGIGAFRDIRFFPEKNFSFRLRGVFQKNRFLPSSLRVSFQKSRQYIIAICHPDSVRPCAGT